MEKINSIINSSRTWLIILQVQDDSRASIMCDELVKKAFKKSPYILLSLQKEEMKNLDPAYNVLKNGPGVIVIKEKVILKFFSAQEVVSARTNKFQLLIRNLNRNYGNRAVLKLSDEEVRGFHGFEMEPCNMRKEALEGFFEGGSASILKEKDEPQDEWQKTAFPVPRAYNELSKVAQADKLSPSDIKIITERVLDVLFPGETVCKALIRLKDHRPIFDQISEDATLLVDNGNIGIYESTKEEILLKANSAEVTDVVTKEEVWQKANSAEVTDVVTKEEVWQKANSAEVTDVSMSDHFYFDAASGWYYNETSGMFYDPASGCYCCYALGLWHRYDDNTKSWEPM